MALFGNAATRRKPWGIQPPENGTPPIYSPPGTMQPGTMSPDLSKVTNRLEPEQAKPGFFNRGGFGADFLGNTVDTLLQMRGVGAVYDPPEQRRSKLLAQQQAENRQYEEQEWLRREKWKRDNPTAPQPTEFERQLDAGNFTPEQRTKLIQDYVRNRANPLQAIQGFDANGNPTTTWTRPSGGISAPTTSVGTVEDGYEFIGGDDTDPKNWRPVAGGGAGSGQPNFP